MRLSMIFIEFRSVQKRLIIDAILGIEIEKYSGTDSHNKSEKK